MTKAKFSWKPGIVITKFDITHIMLKINIAEKYLLGTSFLEILWKISGNGAKQLDKCEVTRKCYARILLLIVGCNYFTVFNELKLQSAFILKRSSQRASKLNVKE